MQSDIFTVIEWALKKSGYTVLEQGDTKDSVLVCHESGDPAHNYRIRVTTEEK